MSRDIEQAGATTWDRLQRSWPFTRIMPVIKQIPQSRWNLAAHPSSTFEPSGIQVRLENVKQGTYLSQPASLLLFEINWTISSYFPLSCFSFRVTPAVTSRTTRADWPGWYVAAYAPARVSEDVSVPSQNMASPCERTASLVIHKSEEGLRVIIQARRYGRSGLPGKINIGFVLVHRDAVQLRIFPSATGHCRLNAFRRTRVWPLNIDNTGELIPFITCANQGLGGCHSSCSDFGPDHMTVEKWQARCRQFDLKTFKGDPDESVRRWGHVCWPLTGRPGCSTSPRHDSVVLSLHRQSLHMPRSSSCMSFHPTLAFSPIVKVAEPQRHGTNWRGHALAIEAAE